MGWDITYHPVGEDEIRSIYFRGLAEPDYCQALVAQFGLDDFYAAQLRIRFDEARGLEAGLPFSKGHAYYAAIIFGFLRKYHYIRGGAFSFLAEDAVMTRYIGDWKSLVPPAYQDRHFDNVLIENYCGGVYIPCESLKQLRADYDSDAHVRAKMDDVFSHGRLAIFWKATEDALADGLGLVEAAEVVEPNPLDLNSSRSPSNLFNCHPDGAILYAQAASEQIAQALQNEEAKNDEAKTDKKKGFLARLFGK